MLILFDHTTPAPLRYALVGYLVMEAIERGWQRLANGMLFDTAEDAGFEVRRIIRALSWVTNEKF